MILILVKQSFKRFDAWATRNPKLAAGVTGALLGGGGDMCAQVMVEGRGVDDYDYRRTIAVTAFLGTYVPTIQYGIYTRIYDRYLTTARCGKFTPVGKALVDNLVTTPIVYMPAFYVTTLHIRGWELSAVKDRLRREWLKSCIAGCKVWLPAQAVTFVLPPHLRLPFMSVISFFWQTWLALIANRSLTQSQA